jgi:3-carboxy-cis,cis-muconate cycloisomerase
VRCLPSGISPPSPISWEIKEPCLTVPLGGVVGALACQDSGDIGLGVRKLPATELGLKDLSITWHVARDHVGEV